MIFFAGKGTSDSTDIEVLEAESVIWALEICIDRGFPRVWLESDCLSLILKLQKGANPRGDIGCLLRKIRVLASSFEECRWSHIRRKANSAANFLANIRPSISFIHVSDHLVPFQLKLILDNDAA